MLGLGVGAGFLGGAALGVAGTMASYSVYHKYQVRFFPSCQDQWVSIKM